MSVTTLRLCDRDNEFWWTGARMRPVQRIRRVVIQGYLVAQQATPLLNSQGLPVPAAEAIQHDVVLADRPHLTDAGWEFRYDDLRFRAARQSGARPASYGWYQHIHVMASQDDVDGLKGLQGKLITLLGYEVAVGLEDDEIPGLKNEGQGWAWLGDRALIQDAAQLREYDKKLPAMVGAEAVSHCLILDLQHIQPVNILNRFFHFMKGKIMSAGGNALANQSLKKAGEINRNERQRHQGNNPNHGAMMAAIAKANGGASLPGKDKK